MAGEAYSDPVKRRRKERIAAKAKNVGTRPFLPTHTGKNLGGTGNFYGTFSGTVDAFSRVERPKPQYVSPAKNVLVNPPKKGGYGFRGVCIGQDPEYANEPYEKSRMNRNELLIVFNFSQSDAKLHKSKMVGKAFNSDLHPKEFFEKNPFGSDRPLPPEKTKSAPPPISKPFVLGSTGKKAGGGNYGCFTSYPSHSDEKYKPLPGEFRNMKTGSNVFKDSQPAKSTNCRSTMNQYVDKKINRETYKQGVDALSTSR